MKTEEILFCKLMNYSLHPTNKNLFPAALRKQVPEFLPNLIEMANLHNMLPSLYDSLCQLEIPVSFEDEAYFRQSITSICYRCYDMLSFTKKVMHFLSELPITFFVLKGVSLLPAYAKMEYRRYGDVDILVPDNVEYEKAKQHLLSLGFLPKKDLVDHHIELLYHDDNTTYLLELHSQVIATQGNPYLNQHLETIYEKSSPIYETFPDGNITYPMLPHTENCIYLLLHMLQHFMSAGFGVKLLYDWAAYLEKYQNQIDTTAFLSYLEQLGLNGFCNAVTLLCKKHLGLSCQICTSIITDNLSEKFLSEFMNDIISGGEFGKTDSTRLLIMQRGGRYSQYLHEFHRQMKNRFPRICKIIVFWPVLWLITGICFLWNNHFIRKTKTSALLATTHRRQQLLRELKLFYRKTNKKDCSHQKGDYNES